MSFPANASVIVSSASSWYDSIPVSATGREICGRLDKSDVTSVSRDGHVSSQVSG